MNYPGTRQMLGFPGKEATCQCGDAGDVGSIPGSGRSPGGGSGTPLQYSCLGERRDGERSLVGYGPWGPKGLDMAKHTQHRAHTWEI